jgi:regulator of RNase E activity RraA
MRARSSGAIGVSLPAPEFAQTLPVAGPPVSRPDPELVSRLGVVGSATASAVMHRMGVRQTFIQGPVARQPGTKVVGPAVTLQFMPHREDVVAAAGGARPAHGGEDHGDGDGEGHGDGDGEGHGDGAGDRAGDGDRNGDGAGGVAEEEHREKSSALWAVFDTVQPGDVLAVQAFGDAYTGCMGEMLMTYFKGRGGAGVVVDGCVRDWPRIKEIGTPLWTRGFTPNYASQASLFPWAYNVPIACSRVLVIPGDIIIADDDGAVVVPTNLAELVLEHTVEHEDWEEFSRLKLAEGGALKKYYPLDDEGWSEYEAWRDAQADL